MSLEKAVEGDERFFAFAVEVWRPTSGAGYQLCSQKGVCPLRAKSCRIRLCSFVRCCPAVVFASRLSILGRTFCEIEGETVREIEGTLIDGRRRVGVFATYRQGFLFSFGMTHEQTPRKRPQAAIREDIIWQAIVPSYLQPAVSAAGVTHLSNARCCMSLRTFLKR